MAVVISNFTNSEVGVDRRVFDPTGKPLLPPGMTAEILAAPAGLFFFAD